MTEAKLPIVEIHFGAGWVPGVNNFFPDLPPDERLKMLGLLDACPNPAAIAKDYGRDRLIQRYAECNLMDAFIMVKADELNPSLAQQLRMSTPRPNSEKPMNYDPNAVPEMYTLVVFAGSNPVRYAGSRVLIEQFGRKTPWFNGTDRIKTGLSILEKSLKESSTPEEFLARLSDGVTSANADIDAVLSHIFAVEFEGEGLLFLAKKVAQAVKIHAPDLWQHYRSLSDEQKKESGITTAKLLE